MTAAREDDDRLADWVDGRLSVDDLAALESEIESDPDLAVRAAAYRATVDLVRQAASQERAPDNLADQVMAEVEAVSGRAKAAVYSGIAAAALLALAFFLWQLPSAPLVETAAGLSEGDAAEMSLPSPRASDSENLPAPSESPADGDEETGLRDSLGLVDEIVGVESAEVGLAAGGAAGSGDSRVEEKLEREADGPELNWQEPEAELADDFATRVLKGVAVVREEPADPQRLGEVGLKVAQERKDQPVELALGRELQRAGADLGMLMLIVELPAAPLDSSRAAGDMKKEKAAAKSGYVAPKRAGRARRGDSGVPAWIQPLDLAFANEMPPRVLELPGPLDLDFARESRAATGEEDPVADARSDASPFQAGDRVFVVRGGGPQVLRYLSSLRTAVDERRGTIAARRSSALTAFGLPALGEVDLGRGATPGTRERAKDLPATETLVLVLRHK